MTNTTFRAVTRVFGIAAMLAFAGTTYANFVPQEFMYDFGEVAIEFNVYHDFKLINRGSTSLRIDSVKASCDCTRLSIPDSLARPGDTLTVRLDYETTNFYGRISKMIEVYTNSALNSKIELYYLSTVGQWLYGIKPEPISIFYLPAHKTKRLAISNPAVPQIVFDSVQYYNDLVTVKPIVSKAAKGEKLEFEVTPREGLGAGTHTTNFRLSISAKGANEPILLTIPVKVVRY